MAISNLPSVDKIKRSLGLSKLKPSISGPLDNPVKRFLYNALAPLEKAQGFLENPNSRLRLPSSPFANSNPLSTLYNLGKGYGEGLINEPVKVGGDVGRALGIAGRRLVGADTSQLNMDPASYSGRLSQNIEDYFRGVNPLATLGNYGAGKWNIPFTNIMLPEYGISEAPITQTAKLGVGAAEPVLTALGGSNLKTVAGLLAFGGGINTLLGDKNKGMAERFFEGTNTVAPTAFTSAGYLKATNPLVDKTIQNPLLRYPLKSTANVLQGVGQDRVVGQDTSGLSITIDALFPIASDISSKSFKSSSEAMKAVEAKLIKAFGGTLRNNKGLYTTAEKFAKGTRAYRKSGKYMNGVALGFEPYQDEDGRWKVRFNRERALLGLGVSMGLSNAVKGGNIKDLEDSLNRTQLKGLDDATKSAVLDEAERMLAGGLGDVGVIKNDSGGIRYSANPPWYKEFYKSTGRAPTNEEFFDLALSRIKQQSFENPDDVMNRMLQQVDEAEATKLPQQANNYNQRLEGEMYNLFNSKYLNMQRELDIDDSLIKNLPTNITVGEAIDKMNIGVAGVGTNAAREIVQELKDNPNIWNKAQQVDTKIQAPTDIPSRDAVKQSAEQVQDFAPSSDDILRAETDVVASKEFNKSLPESFKRMWGDWVNTRRASELEGVRAKKPFESSDIDEIEKIIGIQAGSSNNPKLREFFDTRYKQLQDEGIIFNYREDYLPQLWDNTQSEIEEALGKRLTNKPSFTYERIIDDYAQGIAAGLKPRFRKVSDLVGWYASYSNKAIADKKFFSSLLKEGYIAPSSQAPKEWVTIDPDRFKKYKINFGKGEYVGDYKAPKEIADAINNYLRPANAFGEKVGKVFSGVKNAILTGGIPKTAINAHGFNILARNILASSNPVEGALRGAYYMINPKAGTKFVAKNLDDAVKLTKSGLTLAVEESAYTRVQDNLNKNLFKRLPSQVVDKWQGVFEDPLFKGMIPALKLKYAKDSADDLIKKGMEESAAYRIAAKNANTLFGGINYDELMRSKDAQNVLRSLILAPDWAETNLRTGAGIVKGVFNPTAKEFKAYRVFARNLLGAYLTANILNKALSGHWMHDNESGNVFNIDTGTYTEDGKKRYVRPFGTAVDFVRLPIEAVAGLMRNDFKPTTGIVQNRINPLVASLIALGTNRDYLGRPITSESNTMGKNLANIASTIIPAPNNLKAGVSYATGARNAEEAIMQAAELPVRYRGATPNGKTEREFVKQAMAQGSGGKYIFDTLKQADLSREEKKKQSKEIAKALQKSEGGIVRDNTYYYLDEEGAVKSISTDIKPAKLELVGDPTLDKELLTDAKSDNTKKIGDVMKLFKLGVMSKEDAVSAISELKEFRKLLDSASKGADYKSGAKKGKKLSIPQTKLGNLAVKQAQTPRMSYFDDINSIYNELETFKPIKARML